MTSLVRLLEPSLRNAAVCLAPIHCRHFTGIKVNNVESTRDDEEFRVLNLRSHEQTVRRRTNKRQVVPPPRSLKMSTEQDWTAVWPGPRSFHPASVPFPLRQSYTEKRAAPTDKYANAELIKIPNFLHLTPPAIKKQCEAIKKFCTVWPKGLESYDACQRYFPINIISTDYCHALPTIRHPEARRVTLQMKLSNLKFDPHARDKFLRLVGDRYDKNTDMLTVVADRCPLRKQNYDYALYLVTACYHEAFIVEPWESSKSEADMEQYYFKRNISKRSAEEILNWGRNKDDEKNNVNESFACAVEQLINDGENEQNLANYKEEVIKLLGMNVANN